MLGHENEDEVKNTDVASAGGQDSAKEASKVSHVSHRRSSIGSWQDLLRYCQSTFPKMFQIRLCDRVYGAGGGGLLVAFTHTWIGEWEREIQKFMDN
jgi:hypothetical protein